MADTAEDRLTGFAGFEVPRYTPVPDAILDGLLDVLTGGELKVLLYIARHTLGYRKSADELSAKQIAEGITKRDGMRVDHGTGLSIRQVRTVVARLEALGLIDVTREKDAEEVHARNIYALRMVPSEPGGSEAHFTTPVKPTSLPVVKPTSPPKNRGTRTDLLSHAADLADAFFTAIGESRTSAKRRERAVKIIDDLTAEAFDADAIREACRLARERGAKGPDLLPHLVGEAAEIVARRGQARAKAEKIQEAAATADREHQADTSAVDALSASERAMYEQQAREALRIPPDRDSAVVRGAVTGWIASRLESGGR